MNPALLSSKEHGFQTPPEALELVRRVAPIMLDPCTTEQNPTGAEFFAYPPMNSLRHTWSFVTRRPGLAFVNPPYGRELPKWVAKCREAAEDGWNVCLLVPARPDTAWTRAAMPDDPTTGDVYFWKGRITFIDPATGEPTKVFDKKTGKWKVSPAAFPSAFYFYGPLVDRFREVFAEQGGWFKFGTGITKKVA